MAAGLQPPDGMARGGFYSVDSLTGVHVLVVAPEAEARDVLRGVLEYCGAFVTPVATAAEALEVMRRIKADVVVVEASAADDALALVRRIRSLKPEEGGVTRAIGLLEDCSAEGVDRARRSGYDVCMGLPVDPWALCRTVSSLVSSSGS